MEERADAFFLDLGRRWHVLDFDDLVRLGFGQGFEQRSEPGEMLGDPGGKGDAFFTVGDEQPAQAGGPGVELILPLDDQGRGGLSLETAVGGVWRFEKNSLDPGVVAPFPVAQPAEVDR